MPEEPETQGQDEAYYTASIELSENRKGIELQPYATSPEPTVPEDIQQGGSTGDDDGPVVFIPESLDE